MIQHVLCLQIPNNFRVFVSEKQSTKGWWGEDGLDSGEVWHGGRWLVGEFPVKLDNGVR